MDYHRGAGVEVILPDLHVCDEFDVRTYQILFVYQILSDGSITSMLYMFT